MSNPFTIKIYVPDGDPDSLRIIDRQSSPSKFFVFPRDKWSHINSRPELAGAGVYILAGYPNPEDEELTIYVGQADNIKNRIDQHTKGKDFWDRAVVFVSEHKINSTHAKWLEYKLVQKVIEAGQSKVENGNNPTEPTISESERAEMEVFLTEILQTLPIVGISSFEDKRTVITTTSVHTKGERDTIVVPAQKEGFERVFLGEDAWYAIRISGGMLDKIKYIAGYQTAPISAITHYAQVKSIERYGEGGKYKLIFAGKAVRLEKPIKLNPGNMGIQSPRYTNFEKLKMAIQVSDVLE